MKTTKTVGLTQAECMEVAVALAERACAFQRGGMGAMTPALRKQSETTTKEILKRIGSLLATFSKETL